MGRTLLNASQQVRGGTVLDGTGGGGRYGASKRKRAANRADVDAMVQQTLERFGRVDILVNNAGFADHKAIFDISEADWEVHINVYLKADAVAATTAEQVDPLAAQGAGARSGKQEPYAARLDHQLHLVDQRRAFLDFVDADHGFAQVARLRAT